MILVTGATGNVGGELVPLLEQRGLDVRCLVHERGRPGAREREGPRG